MGINDKTNFSFEEKEELKSLLKGADSSIIYCPKYSHEHYKIIDEYKMNNNFFYKSSYGDKENSDISNKKYLRIKSKCIKKYLKAIFQDSSILKNGEMMIVIGAPGSGKSTIINSLKTQLGYFHADADEIKYLLAKKLKVDINHPLIHKLSVNLVSELIENVKKEKINFIMEKIGDEPNQIWMIARQLKQEGYKMHFSVIHTSIDECRIRNIKRAINSLKEGKSARMVDDNFLLKVSDGPLYTYLYLFANYKDLFEEMSAYYNHVPLGNFPNKIMSICYIKNDLSAN